MRRSSDIFMRRWLSNQAAFVCFLIRRRFHRFGRFVFNRSFFLLRSRYALCVRIASALERSGLSSDAIGILAHLIWLRPDEYYLQRRLGDLYSRVENRELALECYRAASVAEPGGIDLRFRLAICDDQLGRTESALGQYRLLADCDDARQRARAWCCLAAIAEDQGDRETAESLYRDAFRLDPGGPAFPELVYGKYLSPDTDWGMVETAESFSAKNCPAREQIHFSLGQIYDMVGDYDLAFRWFASGNELSRRRLGEFDMARHLNSVNARIKVFTPDFFRRFGRASVDAGFMIFVVGMPRSGTTLTEQILGSHSDVTPGGERSDVTALTEANFRWGHRGGVYPAVLHRVDGAFTQRLSFSLASQLRTAAGGCSRLVTKLPHDIFDVGLIHILLPGARIVHITRNPLDTCLSCFMQGFRGLKWATDLESIREMYLSYRRVVDHWNAVLPDGISCVLSYESLVADPDVEIRKLLKQVDLEPEPACFRSHETHRRIVTPSRWQVRQPINSSAIGRWENYRKHLGPLMDLVE